MPEKMAPLSSASPLPPRFNSSQIELLKWLVFAMMVIDHIDAILLDRGMPLLLAIGRVGFPLFAMLAAYHSLYHSRDLNRYAQRLLLLAVVSIPFHFWAFGAFQLNAVFALAIGIAFIHVWKESREWEGVKKTAARAILLAAILGIGFHVEYLWFGILLIPALAFWLERGGRGPLFLVALISLCLNFLHPLSPLAVLSIPLFYLVGRYRRAVPRMSRAFAYSFYPAHLAVLALLAQLLRS